MCEWRPQATRQVSQRRQWALPRWPIGHLPYANALYSLFMRHPDMHRRRLVLAKPKLHFFDVDISLSITNHIYRSQEYQISKYAVA